MPIMQITETEIPAPSTPYGHAVVGAFRDAERMAQATAHSLDDDAPPALRDATEAIPAALAQAVRRLVGQETELTDAGMRKHWLSVVGPPLFDVLDAVEAEQLRLERQTAKTVEDAGQVRLPPVSGEAAILREMRQAERRRYLAEAERAKPGALYEAATRAAVTGDDDDLLAAIGDAPRESGLRLQDAQQSKIRDLLVARRAPWTGAANVHASALSRVVQSARRFATVAAAADREPR